MPISVLPRGRNGRDLTLTPFSPPVRNLPAECNQPARGDAMQVVILCGGQGTRIRDVADDVPKPMIPVGDRPILWHIMKSYAHFGFKDFILCLGYKGWTIKRYFLDYHLANSDFSCHLGAPEELTLN